MSAGTPEDEPQLRRKKNGGYRAVEKKAGSGRFLQALRKGYARQDFWGRRQPGQGQDCPQSGFSVHEFPPDCASIPHLRRAQGKYQISRCV
ncbi:hypothetical protein GCM10010315_55050 [Streptomyces luteosporeus]|uniref:Uncharacterized protein n=1 Tax=Streptomyces luteosporeus TaxID=173856 RepID=A0ABN3U5Y7_9ACTN